MEPVSVADDSLLDNAAARPDGRRTFKLAWIFVGLIVTMTFVNFDGGATAAVLPSFQKGCWGTEDYDADFPCLTQAEQGLLGALPFLGLFFGCPVAAWLLECVSAKYIIALGLLVEALATLAFSLVINKYQLFLYKIIIGFSYSALRIYLPMWANAFAAPQQKTKWLGLVQGTGAIGALVGYCVAGFVSAAGLSYQITFRIQAGVLAACAVGIGICPMSYIDIPDDDTSEHPSHPSHPSRPPTPLITTTFSGLDRSPALPVLGRPQEAELPKEPEGAAVKIRGSATMQLLRNRPFRSCVLARCTLFFIVNSIQFWATEYFIVAFEQPSLKVHFCFLLMAGSAPVLGIIMGSAIIDRRPGAYDSLSGQESTALISTIWALIASLAGAGAGLVKPSASEWRFWTVGLFIWIQLLFGAAMLPPTTGLKLHSVPPELRTWAMTVSVLLYTLFGYGLGTLLPGIIVSLVAPHSDMSTGLYRAMQVTFSWAFLGLIFMFDSYIGFRRARQAQEVRRHRQRVALTHREGDLPPN